MISRNGNDFSSRFPQIVEAMRSLPVQSCVIDGEAIVTDDKGLAVFDLIRGHRYHVGAELYAFDMLELDSEGLRGVRIQERQRTLARQLGRFQPGIVVNEYFEGDGAIIYKHACALGCEGIVSNHGVLNLRQHSRTDEDLCRLRLRKAAPQSHCSDPRDDQLDCLVNPAPI